jgi:hypothetical protein
MAQAVCVEDSIRYDEQYFLRPSLLLRIFETPVCPWFRSSALETLMLGVAEMHNLPRPETGWLRDFERMRQLLDDIADIRDDLVAGRLTYPVLVGLQSDRHAAALSDQIQTVWRASPQERQSRMQNLWPTIKRLLSDADAYEACMRKIRIWERRIAEAINVGSFPGGTTYLHLVLDLKRALADRLTVQGFEDHPEPFPFFNEHEASPTWPAVG